MAGLRDGVGMLVKQFFPSTGVQFLGGVGPLREVIYLNEDGPRRDAEHLSRSIALATSIYAYTAIMYRASKVAEPPLMVVENTDDGQEWVEGHELEPLLDQPSLDLDMRELIEQTEIYRLVTGGAIWTIERDSVNRIGRLVPWSRDQYEPRAWDGRIYGRFKVTAIKGGPQTFDWPDVVHFREPQQRWHGALSRLDVALTQLDLGHQVTRTIHNFVRKAMFPGGVISPHQDWDPQDGEWEAYKAAIEAFHGGPANAGKPLVLAGGTTFSRSSIPLKELLPEDLLDRIEAAIGSVFGVPPIVLGWLVGLKNSPWSQMSEARQTLYEETIIPRWGDYTRRLTRQLMTQEEREAGRLVEVDTSQVRILQRDTQTRATTASSMRREWTRNERRIYTGQEPLDDERGDEIEGESALGDLVGAFGKATAPGFAEFKGSDPRNFHWMTFDFGTKAAERKWKAVIQRVLNAQQTAIVALARKHLVEGKSATDGSVARFKFAVVAYLDEEGNLKVGTSALPLLKSTAEAALRQASGQLGLSFSVLQPAVAKYAEREAKFLASVMGETTGRLVADAIQAGLNDGLTVRDLVKKLETLPAFNSKRAFRVARTETTRAWNGSQRSALSDYAKDEKVEVVKMWLSSRDARVREEHEEMDSETAKIDEPYSNGLMEPSEPNCRCTMTYTILEDQ